MSKDIGREWQNLAAVESAILEYLRGSSLDLQVAEGNVQVALQNAKYRALQEYES